MGYAPVGLWWAGEQRLGHGREQHQVGGPAQCLWRLCTHAAGPVLPPRLRRRRQRVRGRAQDCTCTDMRAPCAWWWAAAKQTGWCVGTHRPRRRHRTCCSSCRPRRTCAPSCKARRSRHRRSIYHSADPPSQKPAAACAFEAAFLCVFETYKDRNVWGA